MTVLAFVTCAFAMGGCQLEKANGTRTSSKAELEKAVSLPASLSASCSGCHAPGGKSIPDLSSLSEQELLKALQTFKSETDGTSVMHRLARGYKNEEFVLIAAQLAGKKGAAR